MRTPIIQKHEILIIIACGALLLLNLGAVNCLFMGFSVRKVHIEQLWTLKWHRDFDTQGYWTSAGGNTPPWPY